MVRSLKRLKKENCITYTVFTYDEFIFLLFEKDIVLNITERFIP